MLRQSEGGPSSAGWGAVGPASGLGPSTHCGTKLSTGPRRLLGTAQAGRSEGSPCERHGWLWLIIRRSVRTVVFPDAPAPAELAAPRRPRRLRLARRQEAGALGRRRQGPADPSPWRCCRSGRAERCGVSERLRRRYSGWSALRTAAPAAPSRRPSRGARPSSG